MSWLYGIIPLFVEAYGATRAVEGLKSAALWSAVALGAVALVFTLMGVSLLSWALYEVLGLAFGSQWARVLLGMLFVSLGGIVLGVARNQIMRR